MLCYDTSQVLAPIESSWVTRGGSGADIEPMCRRGVPCAELVPRDPRAGPVGGPLGGRSHGAPDAQDNPCAGMGADGATLGQRGGSPDGYFWSATRFINPARLERSHTH
jgi:hypothetical protein